MIKLIQTSEGGTVTVDRMDDVTFSELAIAFRQFALALGYHPDTVNEVLGELP